MTSAFTEPVIEPDLPIVDAHHHFWFIPQATLDGLGARTDESAKVLGRVYRARPRFLFDELLADTTGGHNVRATIFVESHMMYRRSGPAELRSVGEVEFANGMAAMAESGVFGEVQICAGIVGSADLAMGESLGSVLDAHMAAGGGRYRGVRAAHVGYDPSLPALGGVEHLLLDPKFQAGVAELRRRDLLLEIFVLDTQLADLIAFAAAVPDQRIILDHCGTPVGVGPYAGRHHERYDRWLSHIRALARHPNVSVKLGGLGNPFCGLPALTSDGPVTSQRLADEWRPYVEPCIEAFGADRCLFEANFPVDAATADYGTVWNAFKRIAAGASAGEKAALFSGTACRLYGITF